MLDPIGYNFIATHKLAALVSSCGRPILPGSAREPQVIPVDVRVRLVCDESLVPAKAIPTSGLAAGLRPIGTLLDCYM